MKPPPPSLSLTEQPRWKMREAAKAKLEEGERKFDSGPSSDHLTAPTVAESVEGRVATAWRLAWQILAVLQTEDPLSIFILFYFIFSLFKFRSFFSLLKT